MIKNLINKYLGNAITYKDKTYTYPELVIQITNYSNLLDSTIRPHQNIVIYSDYNFYSIALMIYLSDKNVNIIPIVRTTIDEYNSKIKESNPNKILILNDNGEIDIENKNSNISNKLYKKVTSKKNTGLILFSSGTTGKPKLMIQNLTKIIKSFRVPKKQKTLSFIIFLMFDHIGGINTLFNCLISGTPIILPYNRNPSTVIDLIHKHKVNVLPTTPTFLNMLLMDQKFDSKKLISLKLITYGTERMSSFLLKKINSLLPSVKLLQTFGTSETGILKTVSRSSNSLWFKILGEHKIVDKELYIRSETNISGYVNHNNLNFEDDGWYKTGDLVEISDDGYIKIIGRKNKIINVGGLKVLPNEVEEVINSLDEVIDSSVFSENNRIIGNIVCVKIYTKSKNKKSLKIKIKNLCKEKLDKYKVPLKYFFEDLKISNRGKKMV